jgi:hypothetical protein
MTLQVSVDSQVSRGGAEALTIEDAGRNSGKLRGKKMAGMLTDKQKSQNARKTFAKGYPKTTSAYADPSNKKYPVDTEKHVRAAWSYINMPKNRKTYSSAELGAIEGRIKRAAKKMGIEISD